MKIKDRAKPKTPPVTPGVYMAVCVHSIDLGEQEGKDRNGKVYWGNKVSIGFELVGETIEVDGKQEPRILSRTFPVSRAKNCALRKFVESWRGQVFSDDAFAEFDTNNLVGVPAQISVILNDTGEYANIDTVMQLPKGFPAPQATAQLIRYDMDPWDDAAFQALPEWAQDRIKSSSQYQKAHPPTGTIDFAAAQNQAANPAPVAAPVPGGTVIPAAAQNATAANSAPNSAPAANGAATASPIDFAAYARPGTAVPAAQPQIVNQGGGVPF